MSMSACAYQNVSRSRTTYELNGWDAPHILPTQFRTDVLMYFQSTEIWLGRMETRPREVRPSKTQFWYSVRFLEELQHKINEQQAKWPLEYNIQVQVTWISDVG